MPDYTLSFDHWWYFYHRLREGAFAQWNPFSLLGRIAVQWNYIPVSIFSPFLILSELTINKFYYCQVIGTFLSFLIIYIIGRQLKFNRFYALLPVTILASSGYKYWATLPHTSTFLFFYPFAVIFLLLAFENKKSPSIQRWLISVFFLSLSFIGARLETVIYGISFIFLIYFILGIQNFRRLKIILKLLWFGIATIAIAITLNAWHLSFLVNSIIDSQRFSGGVNLMNFLSPVLWKWVFISIIYQPAFILVLINLFFLGVLRSKPELYSKTIDLKKVLILELILLKLFSVIQRSLGIVFVGGQAGRNIDIVFSWHGLVSLVLLVIFYSLMERKVTLVRLFLFLTTLFAGLYVSEYSWQVWPVNRNYHFFFMHPIFASFIPFGAVNLMRKKRMWIIATLVAYHFIGETGCFFLFSIFKIPWAAPRSALMETTFQVILMLESITFFVEGVSLVVKRLYGKLHISFINAKTTSVVSLLCSAFFFISIEGFLLPSRQQELGVESKLLPVNYPYGLPFKEAKNSSEEVFLTKNLLYLQDGSGGYVKKYDLEDINKGDNGPILLSPSSIGRSMLRYKIDKIKQFTNKIIKFSILVKSKNKLPDAVQVDFQDGVNLPLVYSYNNTGNWEQLEFTNYITKKTKYLMFTLNIWSDATDGALFNNMKLEVFSPLPFQRSKKFFKNYLEDFPFGGTTSYDLGTNINQWIYEAFDFSETLRDKCLRRIALKRIKINDSIFSFSADDKYYKFIPAYSQTLNTAPVYSSEIPRCMREIFKCHHGSAVKTQEETISYHPEMNPLFIAYANSITDINKYNYAEQLAILPHNNNQVYKEIMAEEGSYTPRAFLANNVIKFGNYFDEYSYLDKVINKGGFLSDQITTSDKNFTESLKMINNGKLQFQYKEIMAEEGSYTPRAFLANNVIKFGNYFDEYSYLDKILQIKLPHRIKNFTESLKMINNGKSQLQYDLKFKKDAPEHIVFNLTSNSDAYLSLMDLWSKGWRAFIDGKETRIYRGYIGTRFIKIERGNHLVEFKYNVPGFRKSAIVSLIAWIIMLIALCRVIIKKQRVK